MVEYTVFVYFLYCLYQSSAARKIIILSVIPFIIFSVFDWATSDATSFSTYPLILEFLLFIFCIIYFFYEKMKTVVLYPLYQSVSFWVCVGLFLYFTGNFFYLLFSKTNPDKTFALQMRVVYTLVTITKNIILSLALFATEHREEDNEELHIPKDLQLDEFTLNPKNI